MAVEVDVLTVGLHADARRGVVQVVDDEALMARPGCVTVLVLGDADGQELIGCSLLVGFAQVADVGLRGAPRNREGPEATAVTNTTSVGVGAASREADEDVAVGRPCGTA
jgi:hypothetical protein